MTGLFAILATWTLSFLILCAIDAFNKLEARVAQLEHDLKQLTGDGRP